MTDYSEYLNERPFKNRELSWLSFNERVMQEARNPEVPLLERLKFLGIFSSNLDEFFRVRVATLQRMCRMGISELPVTKDSPRLILDRIQEIAIQQQQDFGAIYALIQNELAHEGINIVHEDELSESQSEIVTSYFDKKVRPYLIPIMLDQVPEFQPRDHAIYLAIQLRRSQTRSKPKYALIEVPTKHVSRFLVLPSEARKQYIILLDDVIRHNLRDIFSVLNYDTFSAYTVKMTRDAELDLDEVDTAFTSHFDKVALSLKRRPHGQPVRFIYDQTMPEDILKMLMRKFKIRTTDNFIPGGRYHNFRDFMKFPRVGLRRLTYQQRPPLMKHPLIKPGQSWFRMLSRQDILLSYPYQSFHHLIDLLREAAIDPYVESIKMTLYRVAESSRIINALISALKNGKQVTVVIELQARFDEEANIEWSSKLKEEGVRVIHGVPNYKVHAKLCLITRRVGQRVTHYGHVGTGNFHEDTAKLYSDMSFITADPRITSEILQVFNFFDDNIFPGEYKHLLISPVHMRPAFEKMIRTEIKAAKEGKPAYIVVKTNSLMHDSVCRLLYEAGQAGVQVRLIVRGICSLRPGIPGLSDNIEAISIVDKYLEHARIFVFCNGGKERFYIGSADWMTRNLDRRIEVACPIYDPKLQEQIRTFLLIQWQDNIKARVMDAQQTNQYRPRRRNEAIVRAQDRLYDYYDSGKKPPESAYSELFPGGISP